jgi:hypothetical protein
MQGAAMARSLSLLLAATLLMGGCTLIDQRTFNPRAGLGPVPPPSTAPAPAPALITINFEKPNPVYEAQLREAVDQALARKPNVIFDVVTVVPETGTPEQQVEAAVSIRADARDVARIITDQGASPDQVHMLARAEAKAIGRQVQVYVH